MEMVRRVIVFDAADLRSESAFWAGMLDGHVFEEDDWHTVVDAAGAWRIGVQLAPDHVPPDWPHGTPQQVHLDLHVDDPRSAHQEAVALGARLLQSAPLTKVTRCTPIQPGTRSASAGGTRRRRGWRPSWPIV
jgi:hypothetical protein